MNKILIAFTFLFSLQTFAAFKTAAEAETKLKTFSSEQFKSKDGTDQEKIEDDLVDSLIDAVEFIVKEPKHETLKKEIVRVAVVLLKQDKSLYGAEIILPLVRLNRAEFQKLIKTLPSQDSRLLERSVKDADREEQSGNG